LRGRLSDFIVTNNQMKDNIIYINGDTYGKLELDGFKMINNTATSYSPFYIHQTVVTINNSHF